MIVSHYQIPPKFLLRFCLFDILPLVEQAQVGMEDFEQCYRVSSEKNPIFICENKKILLTSIYPVNQSFESLHR